jgi:hypothetical protein
MSIYTANSLVEVPRYRDWPKRCIISVLFMKKATSLWSNSCSKVPYWIRVKPMEDKTTFLTDYFSCSFYLPYLYVRALPQYIM